MGSGTAKKINPQFLIERVTVKTGGSASTFATYAEGIDLVARVLAKYYLNPKGTLIYGGEEAEATYYHGSTISAVNTSYATDKNWGNAIYKYIISLYNRL